MDPDDMFVKEDPLKNVRNDIAAAMKQSNKDIPVLISPSTLRTLVIYL